MDYSEGTNNLSKEEDLTVLTNGGLLHFDRKWSLTFLPLGLHVNENYLAKILYLKDVNNIPGVRVTTDTSTEKSVQVILSDGTVFRFNKFGSGFNIII